MGRDQAPARTAERRLKFSSVRGLEGRNVSGQAPGDDEFRASLVSIGETFTAAYVAVARRLLLGVEALQDGQAQRRAANLRSGARPASFPNHRSHDEG